MAGRTGRCKQCNNKMKIPQRPRQRKEVEASGRFRLASAARTATAPDPDSDPDDQKSRAYIVNTRAALAAVSERLIHHPRVTEPESDDSGPYQLNRRQVKSIKRQQKRRRKKSKPPGRAKQAYWKQTRRVLSLLRRLNDYAYLISLPFLLLVLIGILFTSRPLAVFGAAGVILPNIGRFAINAFYLVVLPFKEGPLQGVLFFIPPFTFYYLYKRWPRMRRATMQFLSPAIPIACVVLAFTFVPWLRSGDVPQGASLTDRLRSETSTLKSDIRDQIDQATEQAKEISKDPRLKEIGNDAREGIRNAAGQVKGTLQELTGDSDSPDKD